MKNEHSHDFHSNMFTVAPGIWGMKDVFVNFYMIQNLDNDEWFLIDSGLKWSAGKIKKMAAYLFGEDSKPAHIVLTHGHFDHVGSVNALAEDWEVPVYAHALETPYLTDQSSYPPPDPTVGGGLMATMAFIYPKTPINIWHHLQVLPTEGYLPRMNGWKYFHTPGHAPGHISLFREEDKVLIAGDAFVTTNQESLISVMLQSKILSGPPKYFTYDWEAAEQSVKILQDLEPITVATGHGKPMRGKEFKVAMDSLVKEFKQKSVPAHGRYVDQPAVADKNGVVFVPPDHSDKLEQGLKAFTVASLLLLGFLVSGKIKKRKRDITNQTLLDIEYNY